MALSINDMSRTLTQEQEIFLADFVAEQFGLALDFAQFADALAMICEDIAGLECGPNAGIVKRVGVCIPMYLLRPLPFSRLPVGYYMVGWIYSSGYRSSKLFPLRLNRSAP